MLVKASCRACEFEMVVPIDGGSIAQLLSTLSSGHKNSNPTCLVLTTQLHLEKNDTPVADSPGRACSYAGSILE